MANSNTKELVRQFVQVKGADAIPTMSRMLANRTITDINVRDSTWYDFTALQYQASNGTTGSVAWILIQDPPPDIEVRDRYQMTPLMAAAFTNEDPEGKVRLLLDHGADIYISLSTCAIRVFTHFSSSAMYEGGCHSGETTRSM